MESDADRSISRARHLRERTDEGLRRTEDLLRQVDEVKKAVDAHRERQRRTWWRRSSRTERQD